MQMYRKESIGLIIRAFFYQFLFLNQLRIRYEGLNGYLVFNMTITFYKAA